MTVSLRLNEEDANLIKSYASLHGISVSEAMRRSIIEKIEDEFDLKLFDEAKREFENNPATYSLDEIKQELNL